MSESGDTIAIEVADVRQTPGKAQRIWTLVERSLVWAGDRLNPILVKETRQALKSRQFMFTFGLLLFCGWIWSILGVAMIGPDIHYGAKGPEMFIGYFWILAFPLLVIVPFGAFRGLTTEKEDRTYDLLSITSLRPRQIVSGKLGSAFLQMAIYLSAISPCLGFTYMLRGIDFPTIIAFLFYLILTSAAFSVIAMLLSTLTASRHWQTVLSVFVIGGLLVGFCIACGIAVACFEGSGTSVPVGDKWFWIGNAMFLTAYVSYFALVFLAAAAQLTFASDNRSTRLRIVMVVQHALFSGWMAWVWLIEHGEEEIGLFYLIMLGLQWYILGGLMTGETPELSNRAKRKLPQSLLGRVFLAGLYPGPGTGYMLAVTGMASGVAMAVAALFFAEIVGGFGVYNFQRNSLDRMANVIAIGFIGLCYVVIYLGVGLLLLRLVKRFTRPTILLAGLTQVALLMVGCGVPMVVHFSLASLRNADYSMLQVPSPIWTLVYLIDRSSMRPETPWLLAILSLGAVAVFLANTPGVAGQIRAIRAAKPARVAEEDAQLAELKHGPREPQRTSPWDD
ncbi:MAG: hypothetical protein U9N87_14345 [Planctomycetota bacterium]|nr:hypothetical protein [Planctomycetota bacterium]